MEDKDKQNELEDENFDIILWDHDDNEDKKGFNVWKKQLKIMLKKNITLQVCFYLILINKKYIDSNINIL